MSDKAKCGFLSLLKDHNKTSNSSGSFLVRLGLSQSDKAGDDAKYDGATTSLSFFVTFIVVTSTRSPSLRPPFVTSLLLFRFARRASSAMALHSCTSDALFLVDSQPSESGEVSRLGSMSAFLFFALEAISNMFPYIVLLCLQVGDAEMTEKKRRAVKKRYRGDTDTRYRFWWVG
jgi:hypothetical protein